MDPSLLFSIANTIAMFTWIVLIIYPYSDRLRQIIIAVPITLLGLAYAYLVISSFQMDTFNDFGSLEGVMSLFQNQGAVLAGWIHYLAFDLMVGLYISSNAQKVGINRWFILPSLLLTFMLGPMGLLSYLSLRTLLTKKYFNY